MAPYVVANSGTFADFVLKEKHDGQPVHVITPIVAWFIDLDNRANPIYLNSDEVPNIKDCERIDVYAGGDPVTIHSDVE